MNLSIVAPVLDEEESLSIFVERVVSVAISESPNYVWELILVDDGSSDQSPNIISRFCKDNPQIKGVFLTRNFGHQNAIMAGLMYASGDVVVTLDSDLQDPPELIPELLRRFEAGKQVVNAVRTRRSGETVTKRVFASLFYRALKSLVNFRVAIDSGDYRLISKKVCESLVASAEGGLFLRGQIAWFGFDAAEVNYERDARMYGTSKYPFRKSLRLAMDAVVSLSGKPLRLVSALGVALGCVVGVSVTASALFTLGLGSSNELVTKVETLIVGLGIATLLGSAAVLSAYVGRLMFQVRKLPLYVVRELRNLGAPDGQR